MTTKSLKTRNAVITSVSLSIERDMLTGFVNLDFGDFQQGFGGCHLSNEPTPSAHVFIKRILQVADVEYWEKLKGRPVRVKLEPFGLIRAIGHFIKDDWFYLGE